MTMTLDGYVVKGGEYFEVPSDWYQALDEREHATLEELGYVRVVGTEQTVVQARRNRVGRFCIAGAFFSLEHDLSLKTVIAMSLFADDMSLSPFRLTAASQSLLSTEGDQLSDLLASLLVNEARTVLNRHLFSSYVRQSSRDHVLRGQVDWVKNFGKSSALGVYCDASERTFDVLENQIVLAALQRASTWNSSSQHVRRALAEQSHVWRSLCLSREVTELDFELLLSRRNRQNIHYDNVLTLSKLILVGLRGFAENVGPHRLQSIWLDVPQVFERFVGELIRRGCQQTEVSVEIQETNASALLDGLGSTYRTIRPDLILKRNGRVSAIIDVKAKPRYAQSDANGMPVDRISTTDIFQLLFYSAEAQKSSGSSVQAFLVAPSTEGPCEIATELRRVRWTSPEISCHEDLVLCTIDIQRCLESLQAAMPIDLILLQEFPEIHSLMHEVALTV